MIIRLHNLSARAPELSDLCAVIALMNACSMADEEEIAEDELYQSWVLSGFALHTDAWVIYERQGEIVGYVDVHGQEGEQAYIYALCLCVHPAYQGRGVEKLLLWLAEERARQMMCDVAGQQRVIVDTTVASHDQDKQRLYEEEGYQVVRTHWRVVLNVGSGEGDKSEQHRVVGEGHHKFKMDLVVDSCSLIGTIRAQKCADIQTVQQYQVYEKELRAPGRVEPELEDVLARQRVGV